jgi:hypothetical protein
MRQGTRITYLEARRGGGRADGMLQKARLGEQAEEVLQAPQAGMQRATRRIPQVGANMALI